MKKSFFYVAALWVGMACTTVACSSDDDKDEVAAADIDYSADNAASWHNYMKNVAKLLQTDATNLQTAWTTGGYGAAFINHTGEFTTAKSCVQQIVEGCIDIAGEVGSQKIGDPISKYKAGNTTEALYAVESWYSWHSREDYRNNIYSIRNAYYGSLNGSVAAQSLSKVVEGSNAALDTKVKAAITKAATAIWAIPQPFRNNINSTEAAAAMTACSELEAALEELKSHIESTAAINTNTVLEPVVKNYVEVVVLPTYASLKSEVDQLYDAVIALANTPTNANFEAACEAWLEARQPWETSEAFLFGPVANLGLDPNMDSWPLDQNAIVQLLNSGNWDQLNWSGDYDEDNEGIAAAQNVRGFHTLEFLLFKNGQARTVK